MQMVEQFEVALLVIEQTDKYLAASPDYSRLRQDCLSLQPVPEIVQAIETQLTQTAERSKQEFLQKALQQNCTEQLQEDKKAAVIFQQENEASKQSYQVLNAELDSKQSNLLFLSVEQQKISAYIDTLKQQLVSINSDIERYKAQAQAKIEATNAHQHPAASNEHQHSVSPNTHQHASEPQVHTHPENETILSVLVNKQKELTIALDATQKQFYSLSNSRSIVEKRCRDIKLQLDNLATQQAQRNEYQLALAERETARQAPEDKHLKQLSAARREQLKKQILKNEHQIDKSVEQYKLYVNEHSVDIYLRQVKKYLHHSALDSAQQKALQRIIGHIEQYFVEKNTEADLEKALKYTRDQLADFQKECERKISRLAYIKSQSPELAIANKKIQENLDALKPVLAARKILNRTIMIVGGLFLLATAVLTLLPFLIPAGVFSSLILPFIPALVTGTTTLGLGIAAAIYGFKNSSDERTESQYEQSMSKNLATIEGQHQEGIKLEQELLPALRAKIDVCKQEVAQCELRIVNHQTQIQRTLDAAHQIVPALVPVPSVSSSTEGFFSDTSEPVSDLRVYEHMVRKGT